MIGSESGSRGNREWGIRSVRRRVATLSLLPLLAACGESQETQAVNPVTRLDSAGIQIVESSAPAWDSASTWLVSADPIVEIGSTAGAEEELFDRIAGVLIRSDGGVVVANGGSAELRFYDRAGAFRTSVGGSGDGPGEFQFMRWLRPYRGDSLFVFDVASRRVTLFDSEGALGRVASPSEVEGTLFPAIEAAFSNGRFIGQVFLPTPESEEWTIWQDTMVVVRYEEDGSNGVPIMRLPGSDKYLMVFPNQVYSVNDHPFGRFPSLHVSGTTMHWAAGDRIAIHTYDADGALLRIARTTAEPRMLTDDLVAAERAEWLERSSDPDDRREVDRIFDSMGLPETVPMASRVFVDPSGYLWLEHFRLLDTDPSLWSVFGPSGDYLGDLPLPDGFVLHDISENRLAGIMRDEFGVERVVVLALNRFP